MAEFGIKEIAEITGGRILCGDEDIKVYEFSTNSKEGGIKSMFVPVIGEHVDAHNFIKDAKEQGMPATFTSHEIIEADTEGMTYIYVDDTVRALQKVAAYYRSKYTIPVIGITGSVGKTTTKEMTAAALEGRESSELILKTSGNMNSQIGLAQMMFKIESKHKIAVIEMGMSKEGEMEKLSEIATPATAIITNIGSAHIGNLHSKENIRKAKMNIINHMSVGGILLINGDDPLLSEIYDYIKQYQRIVNRVECAVLDITNNLNMKDIDLNVSTRNRLKDIKVFSYGIGEKCDYQAKDINVKDYKTHFTYHKNFGYDSVDETITLSILGMHNVSDALAALAVSDIYQSSLENAKEGLLRYKPIDMRGGIEQINGITIIDDTYNASSDSMKSGIDMLCSLPMIKRRIVVLADILELGDVSEKEHRSVGKYILDKKVDVLITIGNEAAYISSETSKYNNNLKIHHFIAKNEAIDMIKSLLISGDACYFKGSRGMKIDEVVKEVRTSFGKKT